MIVFLPKSSVKDLFDYSDGLPRFLTAEEWLERNPEHAHLSTLETTEAEQAKEGE